MASSPRHIGAVDPLSLALGGVNAVVGLAMKLLELPKIVEGKSWENKADNMRIGYAGWKRTLQQLDALADGTHPLAQGKRWPKLRIRGSDRMWRWNGVVDDGDWRNKRNNNPAEASWHTQRSSAQLPYVHKVAGDRGNLGFPWRPNGDLDAGDTPGQYLTDEIFLIRGMTSGTALINHPEWLWWQGWTTEPLELSGMEETNRLRSEEFLRRVMGADPTVAPEVIGKTLEDAISDPWANVPLDPEEVDGFTRHAWGMTVPVQILRQGKGYAAGNWIYGPPVRVYTNAELRALDLIELNALLAAGKVSLEQIRSATAVQEDLSPTAVLREQFGVSPKGDRGQLEAPAPPSPPESFVDHVMHDPISAIGLVATAGALATVSPLAAAAVPAGVLAYEAWRWMRDPKRGSWL